MQYSGELSIDAVVSRIWNEIEGGYVIDDSRINIELVKDKVWVARANLLNEMYFSRNIAVPSMYYQECCFDIECVSVCSPFVKELEATIPALANGSAEKAIKFVGSDDLKMYFGYTQSIMQTANYTLVNAGRMNPTFTVLNMNRLRFKNVPPGMKKGRINAVFSNPFACKCEDATSDIVIGSDMLQKLEATVKLELGNFILNRKIDKRNNTSSNEQS